MQKPDCYEFLNYPKIVSGQCALENIPAELDGFDAQKPLVITGKNIVQRGLVKKFTKAFYDSTVVLGAIYDEVREYAGISQAREAALLFKTRGCDAIIALGNGPVVDLAKAVNILVSANVDHLQSYNEGASINHPLKPLILVPACSFNGWEATSTMTLDNRRVTSPCLYPGVIILDARITIGCCPECLAESGAIALAQAFTALMDETHNPMIDAIAHPALSLLAEHLAKAVQQPDHGRSCLALANAAIMAGAAFANTRPGMAHLLTDALGSATGIAAGKLMAVLLPAIFACLEKQKTTLRDELCLALAGLEGYAAIPAQDRPLTGLKMAMELIRGLKATLPTSLQAMKVQSHILDQAAKATAEKSAGRFDESQCRSVLARAWEGSAV